MSGRSSISTALALSKDRALDVLFPPRCLRCGESVDRTGALCAACWSGISFIAPPYCARCGLPFDYDAGADAVCGSCAAHPPPFDRARAVFVYNDDSRDLVISFKHADRTQVAPTFAEWMARSGGQLIAEADAIVPVPLYRWRLFARRFNQSALLGRYLARGRSRVFRPGALIRRRATPYQGRRSAAARRRNVRGAFTVSARESLAGQRVLLIDDVFTTGATVAECARVLARANVRAVDVLTLARVVRAGEPF